MPMRDLTGETFGTLTVIELAARGTRKAPNAVWRCRCECGSVRELQGNQLTGGYTRSCGCRRGENIRAAITKHGHTTGRGSAEYRTWSGILRRCHNPKDRTYVKYGARGITVCDRWRESFETFYADMGPKPTPEHSLDRIDNAAGYSPENCRWATYRVQARNRSNSHMVTAYGETMCLADWAARYGVTSQTIANRLKSGWAPEDAVSKKPLCPPRYRAWQPCPCLPRPRTQCEFALDRCA